MVAYKPEAWHDFFLAGAGSSAALAGLLFVGISISLPTIAASSRLVHRSLEAFVLLVEVLLVSVVGLVPGASRGALGAALVVITVGVWIIVSNVHLRTLPDRRADVAEGAPRYSVPLQIGLGQLATLLFVVGAVSFTAGAGGGLYWFAAAVVVAFSAALVDAWVLLIEIRR